MFYLLCLLFSIKYQDKLVKKIYEKNIKVIRCLRLKQQLSAHVMQCFVWLFIYFCFKSDLITGTTVLYTYSKEETKLT